MTTEGNNEGLEDVTKIQQNELFEKGDARYSSIPEANKNRVTPVKSGYTISEHESQAEFRQLTDYEIDGADMRQIILWIAQSNSSN